MMLACSAVMLVGTKNGNISVGEVEKGYKDEVMLDHIVSSLKVTQTCAG